MRQEALFSNVIIEEPAFLQTLDNGYRLQYARMNEVYDDIGWVLGLNATEGRPVDDRPGFWVFETDPQGDTPSFRVLYEYLPKKHQVRLKAITVAHLVEDEE